MDKSNRLAAGLPLPALLPRPQQMLWLEGEGRTEPAVEREARAALPLAVHGGAYELRFDAAGCALEAGDAAGRRHARASLAQIRASCGEALPSGLRIRDFPALAVRALHLDLKFHPPRFDWMPGWLEQLAQWKINMLVVEYEDRFPYEKARHIAHPACWTRDQIGEIVARADTLGIRIVPLVQCLGHAEYVLHNKAYAGLREGPEILSQFCPGNEASFELFKTMAGELLELHPDAGYLHVGGDETKFLGHCPRCSDRARETSRIAVYMDRVARVCEWVKAQGLRPLLWDDMLRGEPESIVRLPRGTVLVYWDYGSDGTAVDRRKVRTGEQASNELLTGPAASEPPYIRYREAGYDVLMAPTYAGGGLVPTGNAANCRYLAREAALHGCLGVCSTHWAVFYTPPAVLPYGIAATADSAWNPLPSRDDTLTDAHQGVGVEFDRRFCRHYFGLPDDTLIHALRLLGPGPMYLPSGGRGLPTYYAESFFVDMFFAVDRETVMKGLAAFFRPDWEAPFRTCGWGESWRAKVETIRDEPALPAIRERLHLLDMQYARGLELLAAERGRAVRHAGLLSGIEAGAQLRRRRMQQLLHELGSAPAPAPSPESIARLTDFHAQWLSPDDAKQMVDWMTVGLARS